MKFPAIILFLIFFTGSLFAETKKDSPPEIKIQATANKTGFVGEAITYEVSLLSTSREVANVKVIKPTLVSDDLILIKGVSHSNSPEIIEDKGKKYYKWVIQRDFLIPKLPGKTTVGGASYLVFLPVEKIVNHPFWGITRSVEYDEIPAVSNSIELKISSLPDNSKKNFFVGCVGDFTVKAWFPPGRIYAKTDAYVVFSVSGYGSLKNFKVPNLNKLFTNNCHLKEVSQNEEQIQRNGRLYSEIVLTCKFVPEDNEFEISPLDLTFFSPESKKYYTVSTETLKWESSPTQNSNYKSEDLIEI